MDVKRSPYHDVCIIGTGLVTALGTNAPMTAASVRANLNRFTATGLIDKAGAPMVLSRAAFIADDARGLDRLLALAAPALQEALVPLAAARARSDALPICLGSALPRPGVEPNTGAALLERLEAVLGQPFSATHRQVLPRGHAAGLSALETAAGWIRSGAVETAVVGAVDSYFDPDTLDWLDHAGRLHSEANNDGFVPGEGAGFCLVASAAFARRYRLSPLAYVLSGASGEEPHPFTSDAVSTGSGLTNVLHRTLSILGDGAVADWTLCDMNGETFRGTEWAYAYLRTGPKHGDPLEIWHPADAYGDVGAASGAVLLGLSIAAWQRRYARGPRCLIWTSSDDAPRAAALLEHPH